MGLFGAVLDFRRRALGFWGWLLGSRVFRVWGFRVKHIFQGLGFRVCACVCVYLYEYTHIIFFIYTMRIQFYIYIYIYMRTCLYIYIYTHVYVHRQRIPNVWTRAGHKVLTDVGGAFCR